MTTKYAFQSDLGAVLLALAKLGDYDAQSAFQRIAANIALLLDERDEALKALGPYEPLGSEASIMGTLGN